LNMYKLLSLLFLSLVFQTLSSAPQGPYCGTALDGSLVLKISLLSSTVVDLSATLFGSAIGCPAETYQYFPSNGSVEFSNIYNDTNDCLGVILTSYGVSPSAFSVVYDSRIDTVNISAEGVSIVLTMCSAKQFISSEVKSVIGDVGVGYCGKYKDRAKLKVVILSPNQTFYFSGLVDGKLFYCNYVPFVIMANGTIFLKEFFAQQSCIGGLFSYYGVNPYAVSVIYDFSRDIATISGPSDVSFSLSPCSNFYRRETSNDEKYSLVAETKVADPSGSYCGEYLLLVKLKVTVITLSEISIDGSIFGFSHSCPTVAVNYTVSNGSVIIVDINKVGNCLGDLLRSYDINPSGLNITYKADEVTIEIDGITILLSKCTAFQEHFGEGEIAYIPAIKKIQDSKSLRDYEKADPSGVYYGQYQDTVTVVVSVLSLDLININGTVDGVLAACPKEYVIYNSVMDTIKFPNITSPDDCLGSLISSFGLDPASLVVTYDPLADEILVSIAGIELGLNKKYL